MKVVAKPIEMIVWFDKYGDIHPIRFKIQEEKNCIIKVDKVIKNDLEKFAGNPMWVFTCSSIINGIEKIYEIKYDLVKGKWILYKI